MKFPTDGQASLSAWAMRENKGTKAVADAVGCLQSQACRWLQGDSRPSAPWRKRISAVAGIAEESWLTGAERSMGESVSKGAA